MVTNLDSIKFEYSPEDEVLFDEHQKIYWRHMEDTYLELKSRCLEEVEIIQSGTHKEWIKARIDLYVTTSLMRLLYLSESFCDSTKRFNAVATAVHIKAMVEIPFHLSYLVWILSEKHTFEEIRAELDKVTWGNKNPETGLTSGGKISQKEFYEKADITIKKLFKEDATTLNMFELIYKGANATGHHNYEGRNVLVGVQNGTTWKMRDRKEWFVFITTKIFQFFLHAEAVMSTSANFVKAIDFYIDQLPENFPDSKA